MPYQQILSRAWQILKRQRALWLFGLLSACTGGAYGRIALPNVQIPSQWNPTTPSQNTPAPQDLERTLQEFARTIPLEVVLALFVMLMAFVLLWMIVALVLRSLSDAAILRGALADLHDGTPRSIKAIFAAAQPFFWRMMGFLVLTGGGVTLLGLMLGLVAAVIGFATHGIGLLCLLPALLLAMPLMWLLELYLEVSMLALVLDDIPVMEAFRRGWEVLRGNFWSAALTGLLLTAVRLAVGLLVGVLFIGALLAVAAVLIIFGVAIHAHGSTLLLLSLIGVAAGLLILFALLFASGLLRVYIQSAWTVAYLHLTGSADIATPPQPLPAAE